MSDDLVKRLRVNTCRYAHESEGEAARRRIATDLEAAAALEAKDAEIERLAKRLDLLAVGFGVPDGGRYIADWQTRIDKFKAAESRAEQAERALAEALSVFESLLLSLGNNNSNRVKAARRFMKEHSKS